MVKKALSDIIVRMDKEIKEKDERICELEILFQILVNQNLNNS